MPDRHRLRAALYHRVSTREENPRLARVELLPHGLVSLLRPEEVPAMRPQIVAMPAAEAPTGAELEPAPSANAVPGAASAEEAPDGHHGPQGDGPTTAAGEGTSAAE